MSSQNPHHARRWAILAVLGIAQLMVVLDATIVNIALPSAQRSLEFSDESRQWVVTAYALAFGSLLLLGGRIGDLFGRKRVFIAGLIGFAVASAIGGAADSFGVLVASRALQGVFGALLAPAALSLLTTTFTDPGERAKAFGIFGAIAGGGAAIGLLLGGVLTEYLSWRWCLYVNLLFAIPAAIAAFSLLVNQVPADPSAPRHPGHADRDDRPVRARLRLLARRDLLAGATPLTIGLLAASAVLLIAFVAIQRRSSHPLLPLRIVLDRGRGGAYLAMGIAGAGMFGVFLFLTFYLQNTLGYSPIKSGLAFLPLSIAIIITATTATTRLVPRVGPKPLVITGMTLASAAMLLFAQLHVDSSYLVAHPARAGDSRRRPRPRLLAGLQRRDRRRRRRRTRASPRRWSTPSQQVGGSVGTALLSTRSPAAPSRATWPSGARAPRSAAAAAVHGYTTAFYWSAAIFALGAVVSAVVFRAGVPAGSAPGAEPVMAH